ncbi:MAG: HRDC domain-containing protein [Woeseiaceae bacterium]|nr:HRDC domain-containing protein [Woeseiaceae bacterium]
MASSSPTYLDGASNPPAGLERPERIAIDTEFMRERTYFAQLCLVQVAAGDEIYILDPIECSDPAPAFGWLLRKSWDLHSGRQDIEVLYQAFGRMPTVLFDTQIAAALTGLAPQIGYAALISELCGRDLPKTQTRADWSRRPLTEKMLQYAADDVRYLSEAADILRRRLEELSRLDWAEEDSARLLDPALYALDPADAVDRLKGARTLEGRPRRSAARLAAWREQRALDADRPRQWILKDRVLLDIAQKDPRTTQELAGIEQMPAATVRRWGDALLQELAAAREDSDDYVAPTRPSEEDKAVLRSLQRIVADTAKTLGIAAEVIAPKKELSALTAGRRDLRVMEGWRRELIGDRLLDVLD